MDDKLVKVGIALMTFGGVYITMAYGKYMYSKGLLDADALYKPMLDADSKLIHTLVDKLQKAEGSQK